MQISTKRKDPDQRAFTTQKDVMEKVHLHISQRREKVEYVARTQKKL